MSKTKPLKYTHVLIDVEKLKDIRQRQYTLDIDGILSSKSLKYKKMIRLNKEIVQEKAKVYVDKNPECLSLIAFVHDINPKTAINIRLAIENAFKRGSVEVLLG